MDSRADASGEHAAGGTIHDPAGAFPLAGLV